MNKKKINKTIVIEINEQQIRLKVCLWKQKKNKINWLLVNTVEL
jgi:hypothetical protein